MMSQKLSIRILRAIAAKQYEVWRSRHMLNTQKD